MPRRAAGLTAVRVKTAPPGRHGDGGGLYLLVRPTGARFWVFRWVRAGRMREAGLGPAGSAADAVSLSEAREKAIALRIAVRAGQDPLAKKAAAEAKATEIAGHTFDQVAALYIEAHRAGWRNEKHVAQWASTLKAYASPTLGRTPVADIDTGAVMTVLEPLWRRVPETATRVRGRIEAVLGFATARGWRHGDNPAKWRGHLANLLPARGKIARVQHHAALPWREVGAFMVELRGRDGIAARALEFAILTAARSGEVRGMRWAEIDWQQKIWTVPAERMKAGREHRVPLSDAALDVLRGVRLGEPDGADLVFASPMKARPTPLSDMTLTAVLRRMERGDLTAHGFRSTFRDWAAEGTGFARELAEAALAHVLSDKTEAAYQRGDMLDKRRRMMAEWATFCSRPAPKPAEVVSIGAAR